jgi:hypothetical protein
MPRIGWMGVLQIGIRARSFNTKLGWATNVEFGVKIPQGFNVQSARAALRELLGGIGKLKRYNSLRNLAENGDHDNHGFRTTKLNLGHWICLGRNKPLTTVISRVSTAWGLCGVSARRSSEVSKSQILEPIQTIHFQGCVSID